MSFSYYLVFLTVILKMVFCESTTESTETLLETFKTYINSSHELDKSDRALMKIWNSDFLLQIVNITSHYRLDMTRHKEHNFLSIKANSKWKECINLHQKEINNSETTYYIGEGRCVRNANDGEVNKKHSVTQMEKEIRKWRKSYRYLTKECQNNNPGDISAAGSCLVEYMQKDNYYITFQRLVLLKMESMSQLYSQILASLRGLEVCLRANFSLYLKDVRNIMDNLNHCYNIKN